MNKDIKVSIIAPFYNVEEYVDECVNSLIKQTYENIEIILVNDGSTDNTYNLLFNFSKKDHRIKLINKENGGLSDARNSGLQVVTGDYITFVDGDDVVSPLYIEGLLNILFLSNSDICCVNHINFYNLSDISQNISKIGEFKSYNKYDFLNNYYYENELMHSGTAWGKLYKFELFNNIVFPKGKIHEDAFTTYKLYLKANNISISSDKLYFYRKRPGSIMATRKINSFVNLIEAQLELLGNSNKNIEILKKKIAYDTYHQILIFIKNYKIKAFYELNILRKKIIDFNELYLRITFIQRSIVYLIIFFANLISLFVRGEVK